MIFGQKVAFIDSKINIKYINKILISKQKISGIFTVNHNKVIPTTSFHTESITHATMCAKKFIDNFSGSCDLVFIEILDECGSKANINSLLISLEWCLDNNIKLINLSIGTISVVDAPRLYEKINKLFVMGIVIVSASSNKNKMTFPASYNNVIGVRALDGKSKRIGFEFNNNILDRIEVSCYISNEIIEYNNKYYILPCANSLATPVISAKVCGLMEEGYNNLYKIKIALKEQSVNTNRKWFKKIYGRYFKEKVNVPIIAIITNGKINLLVEKLLSRFENYGYSGICLSEKYKTDISKKIINLLDFNSYNVSEKFRFYSHYCNVDYVIVHMKNTNCLKNLRWREIDVVITDLEYKKYVCNKRKEFITFPIGMDFDRLFSELCEYLLSSGI